LILLAVRLPQPTGIRQSAHVDAYALPFTLTFNGHSVVETMKLDTGCFVDLVITESIRNDLHLGDELFEVI
jgi:hypothetical protein